MILYLRKFLRNWVTLLLPVVMCKMWIDRKILKKFYVIAVTFHDVSIEEEYKFDRIVRYLHQRFPFLTPEQFERYRQGQYQLQDISLLATFDDGFRSSLRVTTRILEPLGIRAVFFCCSDFIGMDEKQSRHFVANNLYCGHRTESQVLEAEYAMSQEELKSLSANGHLIAAHTKSHVNLGKEWPESTLKTEVIDSTSKLEHLSGKKISWFAFPFGGIAFICAQSMKTIEKRFQFCFSGIRGVIDRTSNPWALPRQSITIQDPYPLQLALFYGATNWIHSGKTKRIESMTSNQPFSA
jgi:hypothetical protein